MVFFGVDASPHAVARALAYSIGRQDPSLTATQDLSRYNLTFTRSALVGRLKKLTLALELNDAYFDPIEGGQNLLAAYPIVAKLAVDTYQSASSSSRNASRDTAVEAVDTLLEAVLRDLHWPLLATTATGELLLAYRPTEGERRFAAGAVNAQSCYDAWAHWAEPVPWPNADDYE